MWGAWSPRWRLRETLLRIPSSFWALSWCFAAPVPSLSTCSTFCCPSVSCWQRLCGPSVCQLCLKHHTPGKCSGNRVSGTVFEMPHGWSIGDGATLVPASWLVPVSSLAFDTAHPIVVPGLYRGEFFFSAAGFSWSEDLTRKRVELDSLGLRLCLGVLFLAGLEKLNVRTWGEGGRDGRRSEYTFLSAYI